ncbi:hypothetical protein [Brevundimonas subvibrioides]|uniref:hypothetical protein n=1 Tax=Brevundimonas subvibrioides TaxID=74313 RepID=UPI0022B40768|nr:hypothetical protein [Brevundimonas subvibrioides]
MLAGGSDSNGRRDEEFYQRRLRSCRASAMVADQPDSGCEHSYKRTDHGDAVVTMQIGDDLSEHRLLLFGDEKPDRKI